MGMIGEFRKFALRGNLIDLAVGFTVGAAFTSVAKSLVSDIIMPPLGLVLGNTDFKDLYAVLHAGAEAVPKGATIERARDLGAVTLNYGLFINNVIAFLLVTLAMFVIVRSVNKLDDELDERFGKKEEGEPEQKKCPFCRTQINFHATRCPQCTSQLEETA